MRRSRKGSVDDVKAIETQKLTKYYGKVRGIEEVDLTVEQGDFFGFIGPNGAGKSTTIRTLLGFISPTSGSARVLGVDMTQGRNAILARVGYLPAELDFYRGMRVGEVLAFSAGLRHVKCDEERARLCERLELDVTRRVEDLSLGNRKKLGIVCALQHDPELLILDEPTSGLDPLMQREFYAILQERNDKGTTIFLSSHVLSEVERYCRRAAVIREGRVLVSDRVEKLSYTGVKRVTLRGVDALPATLVVKDIKTEGDALRFLYDGGVPELLSALASLAPSDVNITDPEFDEVLLHYYEKESATQ